MKSPRHSSDPRWTELVRQARADQPPRLAFESLRRAAWAAHALGSPPEPPGLGAEFGALFGTGPALTLCLTGTTASLAIAAWQAWSAWQALELWWTITGVAV